MYLYGNFSKSLIRPNLQLVIECHGVQKRNAVSQCVCVFKMKGLLRSQASTFYYALAGRVTSYGFAYKTCYVRKG